MAVPRGTSQARNTEAFVVAVDRDAESELIERNTGLRAERSADQKFERRAIAAVKLELMRTIVWQPAIGVLKQADEIEQRSDVRIRLAVVVAEQAFVVTDQAGDTRTKR